MWDWFARLLGSEEKSAVAESPVDEVLPKQPERISAARTEGVHDSSLFGDAEEWNAVHHAYGPAGDVPPLLAALASGRARPLEELWGRLCHQNTTYPASYKALPFLLRIAGRQDAEDRVHTLSLIAAIVASFDPPNPTPDTAENAEQAVGLVLPLLGNPECSQQILVCDSLLALRAPSWLYRPFFAGDIEELYVEECPEEDCGVELLIVPTDDGHRVSEPDSSKATVVPAHAASEWTEWTSEALTAEDVAKWGPALARQTGQERLSAWLRLCCGEVVCPACESRFPLAGCDMYGG